MGLAEDQYKTLVSIGSFKNLEIKVSVGSDRSHTVIMSKEDYNTFLTRHSGSGGSNEDAGKQFNISICPESKLHAGLEFLFEKRQVLLRVACYHQDICFKER